jgi:nucleotide-binding universal stress UspA family protein
VHLSAEADAEIHVLHVTAHLWPHAGGFCHASAKAASASGEGALGSTFESGRHTDDPGLDAEPERLLLRFQQGMPAAALGRTQALLAYGDVVRVITARAARGYDLVVMAAHGWTHTSSEAVGPVARSVSQKAACPVLIVWESVRDEDRGFALMPPETQHAQPASQTRRFEERLLEQLRTATPNAAVLLASQVPSRRPRCATGSLGPSQK